ncbi:hypothetical protein SKAU_G00065580 [Synaphobranchus kaupii]|uniref:Uncharacterized protein n=1 Tax=Synaphobranchus kaupii TaxID=118154 RepID=A0A9Q1JAT1_SYNKA|nr:hypothetical protein SKAU_G00065580 [Synaphobranchus kaupii]
MRYSITRSQACGAVLITRDGRTRMLATDEGGAGARHGVRIITWPGRPAAQTGLRFVTEVLFSCKRGRRGRRLGRAPDRRRSGLSEKISLFDQPSQLSRAAIVLRTLGSAAN